ncbi:MAG: Asp23/Gls24 family envelope stress response protein [Parasporobacterium sp.]|nr:Asp23/Gls24 family envelope stress response protein [Parasporobacterium sp.]
MKGHIANPNGDVVINMDVIAKYAGSMAVECIGIVGMASVSMKDGLVHLLKKDSLTKGVSVVLNDNKLYIDFHVIVSYGISILAVYRNLTDTVRYRVEKLTGLPVVRINMYVEGVRVID